MMRYKCEKCGAVFEETNIIVNSWREYHGECFGFPAFETVSEDHCPRCNSTSLDEFYEENNDEI